MKFLLIIFPVFILFSVVSCNEEEPEPEDPNNNNTDTINCANDVEPPVMTFNGDISGGTGGDVINLSGSATDDYQINLVEVTGKITYDDGSVPGLLTEDLGTIYIDSSAAPTINVSFSYTAPTTVNGYTLGTNSGDFMELWATCHDCWGTSSSNYTFQY